MLNSQTLVTALRTLFGIFLSIYAAAGFAQNAPTTDENSTVTYPAAYFDQYEPFSVSDMLDRIPGINVARQGPGGPGGNSGGPLLDHHGNVVGVSTLKIMRVGVEGLGFFIPIADALAALNVEMR